MGTAARDFSGISVSLSADGSTVAIGADLHDFSRGQVRIYKAEDGAWQQVGSAIDGTERGDKLGSSLSLSADGSTGAIGAVLHDKGRGQVRIFKID